MAKSSSNVRKPQKEPPKEVWARSNKSLEKLPKEPTEAFQILHRSISLVRMIGIGLGYDLKYNWKDNRRYTFTKSVTALFWVLMFHTQALYIRQGVIVRTAEVFALYGISVSASIKLYCYQKYFKNIRALMDSTFNICQRCTGIHAELLIKRLKYNYTYYKMILSLAPFCTMIYLFYPVHSYVTKGELVPFVPIEVMFIDQSTMSGYCIASSLMVLLGVMAVLSTAYMGLTFVITVMNYGTRVDLFEVDFKELDELWSGVSNSSIAYRHMFLRNVCRKAIDMRHYIAEVKTIFYLKVFVFFIFAYLSQILCLYQIRVNNWVPGYALAIGFFMEMIFFCIMGTKLTVENERLGYIIAQSNWYTYDMRSQKLILILLNLAMNFDEMWIGPLAPLSVYTASEMIKSIYSYYTVMTEVL